MPLPKSRKKILALFKKIKDEHLKIIISEVIDIESEHRSSSRFPTKKIENIVDNVANIIELKSQDPRSD